MEIKEWIKCDWNGCEYVAWYRVSYDEIPTVRCICQKHFDESKEMFGNWKIEELYNDKSRL